MSGDSGEAGAGEGGAGGEVVTPGAGRGQGATGSGGAAGDGGESGGPTPSLPQCAAPLDRTVPSSMFAIARCLFEGEDAPQRDVDAGVIDPKRVVVLRGRVLDENGDPLPGASVSVWNHPELGHTVSRVDGYFDLAANGGGQLTLAYELDGYLPARRHLGTSWRQFFVFPDVVLLENAAATRIDLGAGEANLVEGSRVSDARGARQEVLLFQPDTQAELVLPDGERQAVETLHVRVREFTAGERGPLAMPADLPANSGYTYAVAYTADEATEAGAERVEFSRPVISYVDNFLKFPAGTIVPNGVYDPDTDSWKPETSGVVLDIVEIDAGSAKVDTDGDGDADSASTLEALGITADELRVLASRYDAGQSLWRTLTPHFSIWDKNWGGFPPFDAIPPDFGLDPGGDGDCQSTQQGSIIGCERQTLGEILPISGTPFSLRYQSERTEGRTDVRRARLKLSGDSVPASLKRIELELSIAGQLKRKSYSPTANLTDTFDWDGRDAYGRELQGRHLLVARIGYVYDTTYQETLIFGYNGNGVPITGNDAWTELTFWQTVETQLGTLRTEPLGFGGWTIDQHHVLDLSGQTVFLGTGEQRTPQRTGNADVITTVVGSGAADLPERGDGGPADLAYVEGPRSVVASPDGTLFVAENNLIRKVAPDGTISTYAGTGVGGLPTGDGGPATDAVVSGPVALALASDGTLYVAGYYQVRAIGPDGIIRTVVGTGASDSTGDGGPALEAAIDPSALALGPDGSLYIGDSGTVRRVGPDGIISRFAGNGDFSNTYPPPGDGGPAVAAPMGSISSLAVSSTGEVFIASLHPDVVRRVDGGGIIRTVAGAGDGEWLAEGVAARGVDLLYPWALSTGADGSVFFASAPNMVLEARSNGLLHIVVGANLVGANGAIGDNGPAPLGFLEDIAGGTAVGPDGSLYIAETAGNRVRRVGPAFPQFAAGTTVLPSDDGRELFLFDSAGRHLSTLDALTNQKVLTFSYDDAGRLTSATDQFGNKTQFERTSAGELRAIVGPFGETTTATLDDNGYLATVTNANDETTRLAHGPTGLLASLTEPRGDTDVHSFEYDDLGRLTRDTTPSGSFKKLVRKEREGLGYDVTLSTALGVAHEYQVRDASANTVARTITDPAGLVTTWTIEAGVAVVKTPTRTVTTTLGGDPRFGLQAPVKQSEVIALAGSGAPQQVREERRSVTLADRNDPLSVTSLETSSSINGQTWRETWNASASTLTLTSPEGRTTVQTLDEKGLLRSVQVGNLSPMTLDHDANGRVVAVHHDARTTTLEYAAGYVASQSNALGEETSFARDAVGRPLSTTLPDDNVLATAFDPNGNLVGVTPPKKPEHEFSFAPGDQLLSYDPPTTSTVSTPSTHYAYNGDDQLETVTFPSGGEIQRTYDGAGRLVTFGDGTDLTTLTYDPTTGLLAALVGTEQTLAFTYTGDIRTGTTWSGAVAGSVTQTLDAFFRPTAESVGTSSIPYTYDDDGLITGAGSETILRDPTTGLVTGIALSTVENAITYSALGELLTFDTSVSGAPLYTVELTRDDLGRTVTRKETLDGSAHTDAFSYDSRGRLTAVTRDGTVIGTYSYDANDNRISTEDQNGTHTATHDTQDRLLTDGSATFTYTAEGALLTKKLGASTTHYVYDLFGALRQVTLPDGTVIDYVIDGNHRRIGKKTNGTLTSAYLYRNDLNIVAELDGTGAVVSQFVYGTQPHVPDVMLRGGKQYRLITDERGSVRLVIDISTGTVAQRMDYDAWGNVTNDTNPGFQPFGFAGGLYDRDTGLVRFGARDYDAAVGRWTGKDPIGFEGGQANIYVYVGNDPINQLDPTGRSAADCALAVGALAVACGGAISSTLAAPPTLGVSLVGTFISGAACGIALAKALHECGPPPPPSPPPLSCPAP
jgi:RHS repeat-associated protein